MGPKNQSDLDPEELMLRKFRAKCRFRALVRFAIANLYWLVEDLDDYDGDDIKKIVEQAVRRKRKKQLLHVKDKALLCKPVELRTEHEKRYISRIISGLRCFRRYPKQVKIKLASATYFKYYGPGRVVIRERQNPLAMYFIVSGCVSISQLVYDDVTEEWLPTIVSSMYTGDMFGEVSLLHNIPRTATVTTTEHSEFLVVHKDDFKSILQETVQAQWDEVASAMSNFSYFAPLDEVSRREGCIVGKLKSFHTDDIILEDGCYDDYVYFVVSGCCQMIESLQVIKTTTPLHTYYRLYDPVVENDKSELEDKYFKSKSLLRPKDSSLIDEEYDALFSNPIIPNVGSTAQGISASLTTSGEASKTQGSTRKLSMVGKNHQLGVQIKTQSATSGDTRTSSIRKQSSEVNANDDNVVFQESCRISETKSMSKNIPKSSKKVLTYFIQVCKFRSGGSFGFGESMRDRRIVALTPVLTLTFPKMWLMKHNIANIWSRIEHYLSKKIPTKKQLFEIFRSQQAWDEYSRVVIEDVLSRLKTSNSTTVHDVPYSIRIEEMVNF